MRKKRMTGFFMAALLSLAGAVSVSAAFEPSTETSYNMAVQSQDALDGLDVTVKERTVSAMTNLFAEKDVELKVSGIKGSSLKADMRVTTEESSIESYYRDGYYYTTTSEGNIKKQMERSEMWEKINSHIYLDMTSNYLKMLCSETAGDGTVTYRFAATPETLGDYSRKLLGGSSRDQGVVIDSLQGTMKTDKEGHVLERDIDMIYTVTSGDSSETFLSNIEADFRQGGEMVNVALPVLSGYKELEPEKPAETITPLVRTVYVTADVNVRASGDLGAVILGGFSAGSGVTQTGYTSGGWIQVQYKEATGYIWGEYVSETKPVITISGSGTMYAVADVNIRSRYGSDGEILGVLAKGQSIDITGTTDNGWVRVKYLGHVGYIFADYLSWSEPVAPNYVENGRISGVVTEASYGSLTIQRDDGQGIALFNTVYAELELADTIYTGDWVEIYYSGSGAPYTASRVVDSISHEDGEEPVACTVDGVVAFISGGKLELSCSDGIYRIFDISEADIERPARPMEGEYVMVTWMSATGGAETRNIHAIRIMG